MNYDSIFNGLKFEHVHNILGKNQGNLFRNSKTEKYGPNDPDLPISYVCCYKDINSLANDAGRPFPLTIKSLKIYQNFKKSNSIFSDNKLDFYIPQPVTAVSNQTFEAFKTHIHSPIRIFDKSSNHSAWAAIPIIVYDLGNLNFTQKNWIKKHEMLTYRRFEFDEYPKHVKKLHNYAWKILIWAEVLQEFPSIIWFDPAIVFMIKDRVQMSRVIKHYIIDMQVDFLFYTEPSKFDTVHSSAYELFTFFPSNKNAMSAAQHDLKANTKDLKRRALMSHTLGVMIWNTLECKMNLMKWALLCALVEDCIQPWSFREIHQVDMIKNRLRHVEEFATYKYGHHTTHKFDQFHSVRKFGIVFKLWRDFNYVMLTEISKDEYFYNIKILSHHLKS